jgi:hypothetical protein
MKAINSADTIQLRRDLAQLLKRLRGIRREKLAAHELRERINTALADAGSLAQFVTVTHCNGEAQPCPFGVINAPGRADSVGLATFTAQPAEAIPSCL